MSQRSLIDLDFPIFQPKLFLGQQKVSVLQELFRFLERKVVRTAGFFFFKQPSISPFLDSQGGIVSSPRLLVLCFVSGVLPTWCYHLFERQRSSVRRLTFGQQPRPFVNFASTSPIRRLLDRSLMIASAMSPCGFRQRIAVLLSILDGNGCKRKRKGK